ncbi:hypothetical protein HS088_TW18G00957 [Tripterygium wilfordii]|uniref:Uncharacterized protein n=1 Tax=Tripterygium wilfordii TaxID=458696 RepID=A0A7J7CEA8_TRIWF|nr:hypothetical protein HS088_TW18G00957 [Tripterygium wilfordii]
MDCQMYYHLLWRETLRTLSCTTNNKQSKFEPKEIIRRKDLQPTNGGDYWLGERPSGLALAGLDFFGGFIGFSPSRIFESEYTIIRTGVSGRGSSLRLRPRIFFHMLGFSLVKQDLRVRVDDHPDRSIRPWFLPRSSITDSFSCGCSSDYLISIFSSNSLSTFSVRPCKERQYAKEWLRWNSIPLLGDSANTAGADQISLRNFMSPLIAKWQQISNSDKNLFPSFLCSVVQLYIHRTDFDDDMNVFDVCNGTDFDDYRYLLPHLSFKIALHYGIFFCNILVVTERLPYISFAMFEFRIFWVSEIHFWWICALPRGMHVYCKSRNEKVLCFQCLGKKSQSNISPFECGREAKSDFRT